MSECRGSIICSIIWFITWEEEEEEEEKVVVSISVTFRILVMDCVNTIC